MKTKLLLIVCCVLISSISDAHHCQPRHHHRHHHHCLVDTPCVVRRVYEPVYVPVYTQPRNYYSYAELYGSNGGCSGSGNGCCDCCWHPVSCQCADPGCRGYNPCLDHATCCAAFGNIGDADFAPLECDP